MEIHALRHCRRGKAWLEPITADKETLKMQLYCVMKVHETLTKINYAVICSDINKDLGVGTNANAKDSRYQGKKSQS